MPLVLPHLRGPQAAHHRKIKHVKAHDLMEHFKECPLQIVHLVVIHFPLQSLMLRFKVCSRHNHLLLTRSSRANLSSTMIQVMKLDSFSTTLLPSPKMARVHNRRLLVDRPTHIFPSLDSPDSHCYLRRTQAAPLLHHSLDSCLHDLLLRHCSHLTRPFLQTTCQLYRD